MSPYKHVARPSSRSSNCGEYNSDSTYLIAVRPEWYKQGQNCGKMITVTAANGKSISAPILDSCP